MTRDKGTADFILEIGVEPLPARFLAGALDQLQAKAKERLAGERLAFKEVSSFGTFRRLVLEVRELALRSEPASRVILGPPLRVARDAEGKFTPQAEGFARKQGVPPEKLTFVQSPKGETVLAARLDIPSEPALKILSRILPELIASLEFPKSMFWEESCLKFGRPIRRLLALHGKRVPPFRLAGVAAGRKALPPGWASPKAEAISEAGRYRKALEKWAVLADAGHRRKALERGLAATARGLGAAVEIDPELLEETLAMTEHPACVAGRFDEDFLALPEALIATVLKTQLQFFPLRAGKRLFAGFIGVRDGLSEGQKDVRAGYERVVEARFNDARFFIARDRRSPLEAKLTELDRVTYLRGLGSMADKANRVSTLASWIAGQLGGMDLALVAQIAELAYADLVTEVVKEFPELQGALGGWLARRGGGSEELAAGLAEFYFPVPAGGPLPRGREAAVASLAGKLETLAGHFAVGNKPTGSADPFALRRSATGAVRIIVEHEMELDLGKATLAILGGLPPGAFPAGVKRDAVLKELLDFLWGRVETLWIEKGCRIPEIRSVREGALSNLPRAWRRLSAVRSLRADPDFEPLAASFKRASNILRQAGFKSDPGQASPASADRQDPREEAEKSLFDAVESLRARSSECLEGGRFEEGLRSLVGVKPHLDRFFDNVMVMAEDSLVRDRRLRLLACVVGLFKAYADLAELAPAAAGK